VALNRAQRLYFLDTIIIRLIASRVSNFLTSLINISVRTKALFIGDVAEYAEVKQKS
jgi:hypothetical protein